MKTIRTILILALLVAAFPISAQERGFFRIFPLEDNMPFLLSMSMAETQDGSFVLAIDNSAGSLEATWKRLLKLSSEGELLHSVPFGNENEMYIIYNIFQHPNDPNMYIGTGIKHTLFQTSPYEQYTAVPFFVHFDDNLNIISQHLCQWPDAYQDPIEVTCRYTLLKNRNIFSVFAFDLPSDTIPHYVRRLFAEMSLDGEFEFYALDTAASYPGFRGAEAVFEFPDSGAKGMLRLYNKHIQGNQYEGTHGLYRLNKNLEASLLNDYHYIYSDSITGWHHLELYYLHVLFESATTVSALNDSTLLFPLKGSESVQWISFDSTVFIDEETPVLLKTDTEGNLRQFHLLGRMNDTIEAFPPSPIALTEPDGAGRTCFYCCHYSHQWDYLESPNALIITKFNEDFDILWRKRYALPKTYLEPKGILATSDGGCLIIGYASRGDLPYNGTYEWFALKLDSDGSEGSGEIIVTNEIFIYPNPVSDVLHMGTPEDMHPKIVEFYDLQGRLVHSQSKAFENIDMSQLPAGTYTLRVTMEDGKIYSDKVVKE